MTHLSDHFAEHVRASFERQHAMALIHACVMQQTIMRVAHSEKPAP